MINNQQVVADIIEGVEVAAGHLRDRFSLGLHLFKEHPESKSLCRRHIVLVLREPHLEAAGCRHRMLHQVFPQDLLVQRCLNVRHEVSESQLNVDRIMIGQQ